MQLEFGWIMVVAASPCLAQQAVKPQLAINVNGAAEAQIIRGWPALAPVAVLHPDMASPADSGPFTIAINGGPWPGAIQLNVIDGRGNAQTWPFHAGTPAADPVTVTQDIPAEVFLWLTPDDTNSVSAGKYTLTAILDTRAVAAPGAWADVIRSERISITVRDEPAPLQPGDEAEKDLLFANYSYVTGDSDSALNYVNQLLANQPNHVGGLEMKGCLLAEAGQLTDALDALETAIHQFMAQNPNAPEPPRKLYSRHAAVMKQVLSTPNEGLSNVSKPKRRQ
jgi:hypothetical protein